MGFVADQVETVAPELVIDTVCCSIASCRMARVVSFILSNSSMQQIPLSERTKAPVGLHINITTSDGTE
jgi:hypothetical protein